MKRATVLALCLLASCSSPSTSSTRTTPPGETTPAGSFIPGAISGDFKTNLETTWGLEWSGPQGSEGSYFDDGQATDPDTGATLRASIHGADPRNIAFFECSIEGGGPEVAKGFLSYCASVPYDGDQADAAAAWVSANVSKIRQGDPIEKLFGGVNFILSGPGPANASLEISAL